jgi:hypothetical protein
MRTRWSEKCVLVFLGLAGWLLTTTAVAADGPAWSGLELRRQTEQGVASTGRPIPPEAVRVFVYEGQPTSVGVTEKYIGVDYGHSGVLFDRATGELAQRFTAADGWPKQRPEGFAAALAPWRQQSRLVGPGVHNPYYRDPGAPEPKRGPDGKELPGPAVVVAEARFNGRVWRAMQPPAFLRSVDRPASVREVAWSDILNRLSEQCYVEVDRLGNAAPQRFTTADGLASNIVTHLAPCGDSLYAACVDIYDPAAKKWGLGGLCRYDKSAGRWQRIDQIDGRRVRWVTLLQAIGDELWVAFREGDGVTGEKVVFGMGLYPGMYRPKATAIVLSRLADGKWTTFAREPRPEGFAPYSEPKASPTPPTEYPVMLGRTGDKVILFTRADAHQLSGNWDVPLAGYVSLLDLRSKQWRAFDLDKDLETDELTDMAADSGEILLCSNRGVHRLDPKTDAWRFLDTKCDLRNSALHSAAVVGDELWLGYGRQSFGVWGQQGISRYNERTGRWSFMSLATLGTAAPVLRILTLPSGDLWALFGERPYMGAAAQYDYYPRERMPRPPGLGRFAGGKWEFPVEGPERSQPASHFFGMAEDLAALGNRLVYTTSSGVFAGPKPWKRLLDVPALYIRPIQDGKAVEIVCRVSESSSEGPTKYQRALYDGSTDKLRFEEIKDRNFDPFNAMRGDSLDRPRQPAGNDWVVIPLGKAQKWVVGQFGGSYPPGHGVLETPAAIWLFSPGQVVRLDRKTLNEMTKSP